MTSQDTSLEAFESIQPELGERQLAVYNLLKGKELNNTMISYELRIPINAITPRVNELVKMGLVVMSKKDICPITKRRTIYWKVK